MGIYNKIKFFILPARIKSKVETNKEDDTIILNIDDDARKVQKVIKRLNMYDILITGLLKNKTVRKIKLVDGGIDEVEDMLKNHTTLEVIHE